MDPFNIHLWLWSLEWIIAFWLRYIALIWLFTPSIKDLAIFVNFFTAIRYISRVSVRSCLIEQTAIRFLNANLLIKVTKQFQRVFRTLLLVKLLNNFYNFIIFINWICLLLVTRQCLLLVLYLCLFQYMRSIFFKINLSLLYWFWGFLCFFDSIFALYLSIFWNRVKGSRKVSTA